MELQDDDYQFPIRFFPHSPHPIPHFAIHSTISLNWPLCVQFRFHTHASADILLFKWKSLGYILLGDSERETVAFQKPRKKKTTKKSFAKAIPSHKKWQRIFSRYTLINLLLPCGKIESDIGRGPVRASTEKRQRQRAKEEEEEEKMKTNKSKMW